MEDMHLPIPALSGRDAPSAVQLRDDFLSGRATAEDIVHDAFEHIAAIDADVQAWVTLDVDGAVRAARSLDARKAAGHDVGCLAGVPFGAKDTFDTERIATSYGSAIYQGNVPRVDAQPVAALRAAHAILLGKTVTTEFAYFAPGPTANPWNLSHTPGGSSSGSAAAVASGMVPLAFGSQTAGSLIRPASYCGVFALKPTHGTFALKGVKRFAPSLDTLGWIARSADDLELTRAALAGVPYHPLEMPSPAAIRIGICPTWEWSLVDDGGRAVWHTALKGLSAAGVSLEPTDVPASLRALCDAHKTIMAYEAAISLAEEWRAHGPLLSPQLRSLLDTGARTSVEQVVAASNLADAGRAWVRDALRSVDVLLTPAAPGEAPAGLSATGDPVHSRIWTLLGLPTVNVPGLFGPHGLPVGIQLVGGYGGERRLLSVAAALGRIWTKA
ncbi:amidase [Burkholderia orbicola]|uniref:amidase n=1 Tax=Burkholderia orbicola TaxID=2978683 RepID=UPI0035C77086